MVRTRFAWIESRRETGRLYSRKQWWKLGIAGGVVMNARWRGKRRDPDLVSAVVKALLELTPTDD